MYVCCVTVVTADFQHPLVKTKEAKKTGGNLFAWRTAQV